LSPWEKLFVVKSIGLETHAGYLANVYMAFGCYKEAWHHYVKPEHPRKLGDICWSEGNLDQAEQYYSKMKSEAQPYRTTADDDRLIRLAFYRENWMLVVERFSGGSISKGFENGKVCVGQSEVAGKPYLDMLAVALCQLGTGQCNVQAASSRLKTSE
jgi:hypothetical protein